MNNIDQTYLLRKYMFNGKHICFKRTLIELACFSIKKLKSNFISFHVNTVTLLVEPTNQGVRILTKRISKRG